MRPKTTPSARTFYPAHALLFAQRSCIFSRLDKRQQNSDQAKQRKFGHIDLADAHHVASKPRPSRITGGVDTRGMDPGAFDFRLGIGTTRRRRGPALRRAA